MRILIAVHGFPPHEPGVWTYHHAQALSQRHSVWIYTRTVDYTRPEFDQWEERVGQVTVRRVVHSHFEPFRNFSGFRVPAIDERFFGFVDEIDPDVIHVEHTFGLSATIVAGARQRGVPVVLSLCDYWMLCQRAFLLREDSSVCDGPSREFDCVTCVEGPRAAGTPRPDDAHNWRLPLHDYRQALMREALDSANIVTACSPSLQQRLSSLCGLPPGRVRSISPGVPPLPRPVSRQSSKSVRIGYLGVVAAHKGVFVLASASKALGDLDVEVHVHGPVDPQVRAALEAINPSLVFHGAYQHDTLPEILGSTDIQVVPSLAAETFSFVLREAALADVAVIASRIGAMPDFIVDGETGLLVPPGDVDALAAALRRLVVDPELRSRLSTTHLPMRSVEEYTAEMEELYLSARAMAGVGMA